MQATKDKIRGKYGPNIPIKGSHYSRQGYFDVKEGIPNKDV